MKLKTHIKNLSINLLLKLESSLFKSQFHRFLQLKIFVKNKYKRMTIPSGGTDINKK